MSWLATLLSALLGGAAAGGGTLWLAIRCVEWYRIPSREGQSGYFVSFLAGAGAVGGLIVGIVVARLVIAAHPGGGTDWFIRAPLAGVLASVLLLAAAAFACRLRADIPPTLNGRTLDLAVEIRLPAGTEPPPGEAFLSLCSVDRLRSVQRRSEQGSVDKQGRRAADGRWIIPGRVPIFTQRGERILRVHLGEADEAFFVPLPRRPGTASMTWSDWLPRARTDGGPPINTLGFRFRVEPSEE